MEESPDTMPECLDIIPKPSDYIITDVEGLIRQGEHDDD